jgi:hypothetical protein
MTIKVKSFEQWLFNDSPWYIFPMLTLFYMVG